MTRNGAEPSATNGTRRDETKRRTLHNAVFDSLSVVYIVANMQTTEREGYGFPASRCSIPANSLRNLPRFESPLVSVVPADKIDQGQSATQTRHTRLNARNENLPNIDAHVKTSCFRKRKGSATKQTDMSSNACRGTVRLTLTVVVVNVRLSNEKVMVSELLDA